MVEDDRDILGKADALLRRHVPARAHSGEGDIPVLTELITPGDTQPPAPPLAAVEGDDSNSALIAEIARAVQSRLENDFEQRLTQQVTADVQAGIAAALEDMRREIADAVREAVSAALSTHTRR